MTDLSDKPLYEVPDELEDQPLYSIPDDDDNPEYVIDDEDDDEDIDDEDEEELDDVNVDEPGAESPTRSKRSPSPISVLFKTMATPVEGWKSLKRSKFSTDRFFSACFIPFASLAALSEFASFFYEANCSWGDVSLSALLVFISFVFGYFSLIPIAQILLPRRVKKVASLDVGKQYAMLGMSTLALFYALYNLLPMFGPVLVFLPLWTIYILYKGVKILRVPADLYIRTGVTYSIMTIGAPSLWFYLLDMMF